MAKKRGSHVQVMRILRSRILRGVYEGRLPGVRALAEEMDSSPVTVQLALAKLDALGLVRKVERSGTFVTPPSRAADEGTGLFARLALPPPLGSASVEGSSWANLVIYGFHNAARKHRLEISLDYCSDPDVAVDHALDEADSQRCIGTVFLITQLQARQLVRLAESRLPVVAADRPLEDPIIPYVTFDNVGAGRLAAQHLVALGHRRITSLEYTSTDPTVLDRIAGVLEYLDGCGLPLRRLTYHGNSEESLTRLVEGLDSCTALINLASPDLVPLLMMKMSAAGKRIPEDLSLIGIEGNDLQRQGRTTCVLLQDERMGETALEMLLDEELLANPRHVFVPVRLADHGTTCPPGGGSQRLELQAP